MKLYLSSYGLGSKPELFRELVGAGKRVAVILNAQDLLAPDERKERLAVEIERIASIGLRPEELDLRNYFARPDTVAKWLQQFGAVWVRGGNVFVLRRAMRQSGFDTAAQSLVKANQLVYGGFSAGSCVVAPSLRGIELVDDPHAVPAGYNQSIMWDGLGWIDFSIAPHYRSNHHESPAIEKLVACWQQLGVPFKALHDGEVVVVADNRKM